VTQSCFCFGVSAYATQPPFSPSFIIGEKVCVCLTISNLLPAMELSELTNERISINSPYYYVYSFAESFTADILKARVLRTL
jgi:hypothetical protein